MPSPLPLHEARRRAGLQPRTAAFVLHTRPAPARANGARRASLQALLLLLLQPLPGESGPAAARICAEEGAPRPPTRPSLCAGTANAPPGSFPVCWEGVFKWGAPARGRGFGEGSATGGRLGLNRAPCGGSALPLRLRTWRQRRGREEDDDIRSHTGQHLPEAPPSCPASLWGLAPLSRAFRLAETPHTHCTANIRKAGSQVAGAKGGCWEAQGSP